MSTETIITGWGDGISTDEGYLDISNGFTGV